ncbi:Uncharacterized protein Cob_v006413 [Colletotrichum orbiculare MAFF 240422]|uniref:Uncharacterized protein n=1 Tax=Colletotrichum orbiculare (strain 104-T / ATCC 96160 / CBS 514.97 / LARS 414 / MAFF 240422) TaxID=1213857 RepID=N4VG98_COLOR|nr:Uncharacterized protein Cob_v006413 [Colletotrichum orbiculare MAFF 240422]
MIWKGFLTAYLLTRCISVTGQQQQQKPLDAGLLTSPAGTGSGDGYGADEGGGWERKLNFSSPAPHLFASAHGLLKQAANTAFPNGHTLAAVEVPAFTLLYHGRMDGEGPPSPEWLAFDIEMAYGIMGSTRQSYMLSYQTTRPVKLLYFDGESAALMGLGQLDSQMLHLYGNVSGPVRSGKRWWGMVAEYERAEGLCDWLLQTGLRSEGGNGDGIEGVVRMNAGFELIWCDFGSKALRLVSWGNVTAPQVRGIDGDGDGDGEEQREAKRDEDGVGGVVPTSVYPLPEAPKRTDRPVSPPEAPGPPNWRGIFGPPVDREPFLQSQAWGWFASGTWHYGVSGLGAGVGETRARVLGCGIASWYSERYWGVVVEEERKRLNLTEEGLWKGTRDDEGVALKELGRRRRLHHLEDATSEMAAGMRRETEEMLRDALEGTGCSGMEWVTSTGEIVQRSVGHLMAMELATRYGGHWDNTTAVAEWLYKLRGQSHMFLVSFLEFPHDIGDKTWSVDGPLFGETYSRCRYRYTRLLVDLPLGQRERDLRDAVEEVMGGLCGVLLEVGFEIEKAWYQLEEGDMNGLKKLRRRWEDSVKRVRAWVGWEEEFIRCDEVCGWDERCYIPMWPMLRPSGDMRRPSPPPEHGPRNDTEPRSGPPPNWGQPGYGRGNRTGPGYGPPGRGPERGPGRIGDETDLWKPKCIKIDDMMPRRV